MPKFLIRTIAKMADASGMYRVRVLQVSETIQSMADAETLVDYQSEKRQGFPIEILEVSDADYDAALGGAMCGYAKASDLTAKWAPSPSIYDVQYARTTEDLVNLNID